MLLRRKVHEPMSFVQKHEKMSYVKLSYVEGTMFVISNDIHKSLVHVVSLRGRFARITKVKLKLSLFIFPLCHATRFGKFSNAKLHDIIKEQTKLSFGCISKPTLPVHALRYIKNGKHAQWKIKFYHNNSTKI